jgi:hypothetical protein
MIEINGSILIFGASFDGILDAYAYSLLDDTFLNLTIDF